MSARSQPRPGNQTPRPLVGAHPGNTSLTALHTAHVAALAAQVAPDGEVHDPHTGGPAAADHYAHCSTALALACAGHGHERMFAPLRAWQRLPDTLTGHLPFNRLLLQLLARHACPADTPQADRSLLTVLRDRCQLQTHYPSNNWTLLAQACRLIESDTPNAQRTEAEHFDALLQQWTTPAGGFIDYPANVRDGSRVATPFAYHHKALFLAALGARLSGAPSALAHARRLYDWLVHCWDPAGYAGGLGRSSHALFGDACLAGALILLGEDHDAATSPLHALSRRLMTQRREDGLLWLDPAGPTDGDAAWDGYMRLAVYNAWFAAVVGICRLLGPLAESQRTASHIAWRADRCGLFHDEVAGVLALRPAGGGIGIISTRGQAPQSFSREHAELRYAGGVVVHARDAAGRLLAAPPVRISRTRLSAEPALAGPVPLFRWHGELHGLTDFEETEIHDNGNGQFRVQLEGKPTAVLQPLPRTFLARFVATLDWRLLGGRLARRQALHRTALPGLRATRLITLDLQHGRIDYALTLQQPAALPADVEWLNPGASMRLAGSAPTPTATARCVPLPSSLPGALGCRDASSRSEAN